jgi:GTP cyclohydrolase I
MKLDDDLLRMSMSVEEQLRHIEGLSRSEGLREGIEDTPNRVADAWRDFWAAGYRVDVDGLLKTFLDGADGVDEMIVVKNIPLYSHCEHHLAAIFGTATVAYIPNGRIVGLSKINRVVDAFARRLQVQERLTAQIAEAIDRNLKPIGVGVQVRARHLCMESRGVCQQGHYTITNALKGAIKDDAKARSEFLAACNGG